MFQLDPVEYGGLLSQFGIAKKGRGGRQTPPFVFTESGIAMLSSVLNSKRAIEINIAIMRLFIRLRSFHVLERKLEEKISGVESETKRMFRIVFEKLDDLEVQIPILPEKRKKIGLNEK